MSTGTQTAVSPEAFLKALAENKVRISKVETSHSRMRGPTRDVVTESDLREFGGLIVPNEPVTAELQYKVDFTPITSARERREVFESYMAAMGMPVLDKLRQSVEQETYINNEGLRDLQACAKQHGKQFPGLAEKIEQIASAKASR